MVLFIIHYLIKTDSPNFPVTDGSTFGGGLTSWGATALEMVYAQIDPNTGNILFATYLGGNGNDRISRSLPSITIVGGTAYIVLSSLSTDMPVTD